MTDIYSGLKIPDTLPFAIVDKVLIVIGELDIGLRPATLPPITQVTMVDCCDYLLILILFMKVFITMK